MTAIPTSHAGPLSGSPTLPTSRGTSFENAAPLSLCNLEFSLATAPLDSLEVVARSVTPGQMDKWFARFSGTAEAGLLSTCHRVELFLLLRSPEAIERWRGVLPGPQHSWKMREGRESVQHLFRVAAGRESLAVGEAEARQQVLAAGRKVMSRYPRPVLRELFAGAVEAADSGFPEVAPNRSIAAVAAAYLMDLVGDRVPRVVVVGSGTVGRQVTECLAASSQVTVVFHERPPEQSFLDSTGARALPLDRLTTALSSADAVVTAAKFGNHGLHASDLPRDHPLVLVDLGVPRNIDPGVQELPNVRLVDLEELHGQSTRSRSEDDRRVEEAAAEFAERLERLLLEPWIDSLRRVAEGVRRTELEHARSFLGHLDPGQELAIDRLTRRLVARLLNSPTERLRALPGGPQGELQRRLAVELLSPRFADP